MNHHVSSQSQSLNGVEPWSLADLVQGGVYEVDTCWVEAHGRAYQLVDIRNLADFSGPLGHIAGAELVPVSALEQLVQEWPMDTPLVLLCNDGFLAAEAARMLREMGYEKVAVMRGGMREWHAQGKAVSYDV